MTLIYCLIKFYIKYREKIDPFWFKYGSIENMTLGYGGLIYNYSNMMEFPSIRRVGAIRDLLLVPYR